PGTYLLNMVRRWWRCATLATLGRSTINLDERPESLPRWNDATPAATEEGAVADRNEASTTGRDGSTSSAAPLFVKVSGRPIAFGRLVRRVRSDAPRGFLEVIFVPADIMVYA